MDRELASLTLQHKVILVILLVAVLLVVHVLIVITAGFDHSELAPVHGDGLDLLWRWLGGAAIFAISTVDDRRADHRDECNRTANDGRQQVHDQLVVERSVG